MPFILVFYALLLLGDEVGWKKALWLPVVVCLLPLSIALILRVVKRVLPHSGMSGEATIAKTYSVDKVGDTRL